MLKKTRSYNEVPVIATHFGGYFGILPWQGWFTRFYQATWAEPLIYLYLDQWAEHAAGNYPH